MSTGRKLQVQCVIYWLKYRSECTMGILHEGVVEKVI